MEKTRGSYGHMGSIFYKTEWQLKWVILPSTSGSIEPPL